MRVILFINKETGEVECFSSLKPFYEKYPQFELILNLKYNEFQPLSDFERQNELVAELKTLGFNGYITNNEIAIF